jgi:signal transduction histidine kinase
MRFPRCMISLALPDGIAGHCSRARLHRNLCVEEREETRMHCKPASLAEESDAPGADQDLQLLREIVAIGNQTHDFERALCLALPRVAQRCACKVGQAFLLGGDWLERLVLCTASYEAQPGLSSKLRTPATQELEDAGYLRRVAETRLPFCSAALVADLGGRAQAAVDAGLVCALAIPVVAGAETVALLECLADYVIECDAGMLETLASVGVALGRPVERQRCNSAIRRTERLASMGTFVAGIAHLKQDYDKQRSREVLGEIIADAERCAQTVKNLVKFARQEPSERTRVNVAELIYRVVGIARRSAEKPLVRFELDIPEPLPGVLAEATAIEQALVSVINSARAASESGRALRIHAGESRGNVRICLSAADFAGGRRVRSDPAFEMAQGIIAQHGGTISIDKLPGGDSTITIELPVNGQSPGRARES